MTAFPHTPEVPLIRTDFSDEAAWEALLKQFREPVVEMGFLAHFTPVSEYSYSGSTLEALRDAGFPHVIVLIADTRTMTDPRHPILVAELHGEGRTFRTEPGSIQSIENNLTLANMDWEEFADRIDAEGVFISFD
jgi:hypothetical protein